ncbi:hypothetical protein ACTXT7_005712 [Hymenolepis weldensis]
MKKNQAKKDMEKRRKKKTEPKGKRDFRSPGCEKHVDRKLFVDKKWTQLIHVISKVTQQLQAPLRAHSNFIY